MMEKRHEPPQHVIAKMSVILAFSVQQIANRVTWYKATSSITQTKRNYLRTHHGSPPFRSSILSWV